MNFAAFGTSFFGNATTATFVEDYPAYTTYTSPFFLFSGAGGSDEMYFPQSGVYLLQFQLITASSSSIDAVDVVSNSGLLGVTVLSSSANYTAPSSTSLFMSFDVIRSLTTGVIAFPDRSALLTLYGPNWSDCSGFWVLATLLY